MERWIRRLQTSEWGPRRLADSRLQVVEQLLNVWVTERGYTGSMAFMRDHWAFDVLVHLGHRDPQAVLPSLAARLQEQPGPMWFVLLSEIVGDDAAAGEKTVAGATRAWRESIFGVGHLPNPATPPEGIAQAPRR